MRPRARQVPKREARVILLAVPPLIFRLITRGRRLRSAALLSGGTAGSAMKTEQFLDELRNAPAQLALHRRWVIQESAAAGQQFTLQPQLDPPPLPLIGMGEGLRLGIDFMDCRRPPGQPDVLGVEGLQVVDVPQLLGTSVMMVGGVEVADQDPTE